jgi:hypothetical protein
MDPDHDLLDKLDRREAGGPTAALALAGELAAIAGIITYFTFTMELHSSPDIARDPAVLVFIVSAVVLGLRRFRLK